MKILLINQFYKPDVAATGQLLADLAESAAAAGHEVHVLCSCRAYGGGKVSNQPSAVSSKQEEESHKPSAISYKQEEGSHKLSAISDKQEEGSLKLKANCCKLFIHRVKACGFGRGNIFGRLVDYLSFYVLAMWKALFLPKMDVCVVLTTPPFIALVGLLLRRVKGTKLVLWTMDLYPEVPVAFGVLKKNSLPHRLLRRLSRHIYRRAFKIISLGEVMTKRLIEAGADSAKITTVHNWVPGEVIRPQPFFDREFPLRKSWQLNGEATVMYSGNLGGGHELDTVVRAVASLDARQQNGLRVLFIGKGKSRQSLEELVAELSLNNIDFHDPVPLDELNDSLAVGQVHIVSQREGTQGLIVPSKIYGIMAAGRPVIFIGPEDCEPAHIIRDSRAGIVVSSGDVVGVADAIRTLTADSALRSGMGNLARDYYEKHFGLEHSTSKIISEITGTLWQEPVPPKPEPIHGKRSHQPPAISHKKEIISPQSRIMEIEPAKLASKVKSGK